MFPGNNIEKAEKDEKMTYRILVGNLAGRGLGVDEIILRTWLGVGRA